MLTLTFNLLCPSEQCALLSSVHRSTLKSDQRTPPRCTMTIVTGGAVVGIGSGAPSSRSNSRNKNSRFSNSRIRHGGSSGGHGSSSAGGHPFAHTDENGTKREIKQRFQITKKLGSGTYGKVSLAYDHKYDREVAVKLIKKSAIENKQDLVRIRREIRIMSALNHPNIIQIFEVFENKDKIILVMEYANGGELYDYVSKNGSLPEAEARRIFRQITSAVLYCHKHKVAHRDLKLENILMDSDNNAKIADFGLSNYFNDKTLLTTFCGSPLYASPEIINGTPYRGPEVDCWSLGILLYTLVYGSMPFDGRDFNRMVRQIKRGNYYEPDTPSTASMLIRNMLRVNPDRRADIDDIASHWWLNLEENMPVIQELPENQITDHTPLTERAETMIVQDLADETDVFMEFGHLSEETRRRIEEFRRRRKEAEEYNENSPIKPPKAPRTDNKVVAEMTSKEKSLRHDEPTKPPVPETVEKLTKTDFSDPLERLRQLENRLQGRGASGSPVRQSTAERAASPGKPPTPTTPKAQRLPNYPLPAQPASPHIQQKIKEIKEAERSQSPSTSATSQKPPGFASATAEIAKKYDTTVNTHLRKKEPWHEGTDPLNVLMNKVVEQCERNAISTHTMAQVRTHPEYSKDGSTLKPLVQTLIATMPMDQQEKAFAILEQKSSDLFGRQFSGRTIFGQKKLPDVVPTTPKSELRPCAPQIGGRPSASKYQVAELPSKVDTKAIYKPHLDERPWHSVEVGFETDEDSSETPEANGDTREVKSDGELVDDEECDDEEDFEDEEDYESDINELAETVENSTPKIVEDLSKDSPPKETEATAQSTNHLSTFDRGLAKRQSKGKYQHNHVELYGRGVSTEVDSPPPSRRRIGGPQPTPDQSPVLFDKAKKYIMKYPDKIEESDDELSGKGKKKPSTSATESKKKEHTRQGSEPPRDPPPVKSDEESEYEEETEEESEEEEGEVVIQPRTSIIGYRTITPVGPDGVRKEAPIVPVRPQVTNVNTTVSPGAPPTAKPYTSPAMNGVQQRSNAAAAAAASKVVPINAFSKPVQSVTPATTTTSSVKTTPSPIKMTTPSPVKTSTPSPVKTTTPPKSSPMRTEMPLPIELTVDSDYRRESAEKVPPVAEVPKPAPPKLAPTTTTTTTMEYTRPSYLDERKLNEYRPSSMISNFMNSDRVDRRKSFHELTPTHEDLAGNRFFGSTATSRYDDPDPHENNWSTGKSRFEVYQTRAERAAERNNYSHRPISGSYWHSDRPSSVYVPGSYTSRFNDDYSYRRPSAYETERPVTPGNDYTATSTANHYRITEPQSSTTPSDLGNITTSKDTFLSRFRPVTRRISSALRDADGRKARARSQSMERKMSFKDENDPASTTFNSRLMTPDIGTLTGSERSDYSYVSYHDSGANRVSQPRDPTDVSITPARGILKNKQATELEPRATSIKSDTQAGPLKNVKHMFGRLKRQFSQDKSVDGSPMVRLGSVESIEREYSTLSLSARGRTPSNVSDFDANAAKKRSFLNMARRRTTEVRVGADGKIITNGYTEDDFKRPRSPIDRIKSLFRKSKDNLNVAAAQPSSAFHSYNPAGPTAASSRFSTTDKIFGSYPSSTQTGQKFSSKRYTGATSSFGPSSRYSSYTPSANPSRHWYEDSHLY
uniref:Protein kinase domain-containing protein n=1 Tax=Panagrellus redivivus TaxID=6233 RepID=A0A7E5A053_PANRE